MPARPFPSTPIPTSRTFNPGTFPQTVFEAQNGATTVMRYSNKLVNAKMTLTFANIPDTHAQFIVDHYVDVNSDWDFVTFNRQKGLQGIDGDGVVSDLSERLSGQPGGMRWRYMGPPQITSVQPNVSTVKCEFCAYLDG